MHTVVEFVLGLSQFANRTQCISIDILNDETIKRDETFSVSF